MKENSTSRHVIYRLCLGLFWFVGALSTVVAQQGLAEYYEAPREASSDNLRYEQAFTVNDHIVLLYQKITIHNEENGDITIAGRVSQSDGRLGEEFVIAADLPFVGTGTPPLLFSASSDAQGHIYLAYSNSSQSVTLLAATGPASAQDYFHNSLTFTELGHFQSDQTIVSPRLYLKPGGGFVVLVTQSTGSSQNSLMTRSSDGNKWQALHGVDTEFNGNINSNPTWLRQGNREYLVFQSLSFSNLAVGAKANYQLYIRYSDNEGQSWSNLKLITDFVNPKAADSVTAANYGNQRPLLVNAGGQLQLFWERTFGSDLPQIWTESLNAEGVQTEAATAVTNSASGAFGPVWYSTGDKDYLSWFSSSARGSEAYLSIKNGKTWIHRNMSKGFMQAVLYPTFAFAKGKLHYFYYARTEKDPLVTHLVWVEPDQHVDTPTIAGINFEDGQRNKVTQLRIRVLPAPDVSGFAAYNIGLSRTPSDPLSAKALFTDPDNPPPLKLEGDGIWYINARVQDKAGNWSPIASIRYVLDTTPPDPVMFATLPLDEKGYLRSNTFNVGWKTPPQDDLAGYSWSLQYLGDISINEAFAKSVAVDAIPVMGNQTATSISRTNLENGIYILAVWAYDKVGNRSPPRFTYLFANKYIPHTVINTVTLNQDILGDRLLDISGRGFTRNGVISRIVLDRDGLAPFDYVYYLDKGDYTLATDTRIQGVKLSNVRTASYVLGIEHTERGFEFSGRRLNFEERGIIKFGDFSLTALGSFKAVPGTKYSIQAGDLILWLVLFLLAIIALVSVFQLRSVYRESQMLEQVAVALIEGTPSSLETDLRKVKSMRQRRLGLRFKFAGFFVALTIAVVLLISLPLSNYTLSRQKAVLADGLQKRLEVLVESLQSSANIYLQTPDQYSTELLQLANQGSIMEEVRYITITSQGQDKSDNFDIVWASNDKRISGDETPAPDGKEAPILKRSRTSFLINGSEQTKWFAGRSGINDSLSPEIPRLRQEFDTRVRQGLGTLPVDIDANNQKLKSLILNSTDAGKADAQATNNMLKDLLTQRTIRLRELSGAMLSKPVYDAANYDPANPDYIFYKPIYFPVAGEAPQSAKYYRGLIRVGVSTVPINETITTTQNAIILQLIIFVIIALVFGIVLAIVLSAIIVGPIRNLVDEVNKIKGIITLDVNSQVQKFEEHAKTELVLKSNDEMSDLNETFNQMVHVLSKAADANVDLYAGKDIQRKFLPLDKQSDGNKGTTGALMTQHLDIFGYYEGAWGVSGDYFDYLKISKDVFAFIKCDISGKGVSAALIMVEVATLFQNYFENWEARHPAGQKTSGKPLLSPLIISINDLIAAREFKGKFAAMNIVLLNEVTGECNFCHAGDDKVYIYRSATRLVELVRLAPGQVAAGALSSKDFPIQFKEDYNHLNQGDMLLYFTDGIEESQSLLRNSSFESDPLTRDDVKAELIPEGIVGQQHEELGISRINTIVEAVMRRGSYTLEKAKKPIPDRILSFNFKDSQGRAEDAVLCLAAVERIYRLIPYPNLTDKDRIQIDKKVDDRLMRCFDQYPDYFHSRAREKELSARKSEIDSELSKLQGTRYQKEFEPVQIQYDEQKMAYENDRRAFESEMKRSGGTLDDPDREQSLDQRREKLVILEDRLKDMRYKRALNRLQEYERDVKEYENSLYRIFGNLREDPQFDDLTLLAIRKL